MADETTPDAVEAALCKALEEFLAERARRAKEVAEFEGRISRLADCARNVADDRDSLREQLRKVEGERDREREHATKMEERALDLVRDVRLAQVELHALRSLLPDVRACAEYIVERGVDNADGSARRLLAALAALAALDSHECPECHRNSDHKMSCGRGGSKGGRFGVSLDSQGGEGVPAG